MRASSIRLADPRVLELNGAVRSVPEPHVDWYVGVAPEAEPSGNERVVIATLHIRGANGGCDVIVGSRMIHPNARKVETEDFSRALEDSDALEALYDFARIQARVILATLEVADAVPAAAPKPEFSSLASAEDDETDNHEDEVTSAAS